MQFKIQKKVCFSVGYGIFCLMKFKYIQDINCYLYAKYGDEQSEEYQVIILYMYDFLWEIDVFDSVVFWINFFQVLVVDVGEYCLVFDNFYSWFKFKQIYYWYYVVCGDKLIWL